jgi:hypothetical protein
MNIFIDMIRALIKKVPAVTLRTGLFAGPQRQRGCTMDTVVAGVLGAIGICFPSPLIDTE